MSALILDHPWGLDECLDPASPALGVLLRFNQLATKHDIEMVRLITSEECEDLKLRVYSRRVPRNDLTAWIRVLHQLVRESPAGTFMAVPEPEPPDLTPDWKIALRDALADLEDWRKPQVVVPRSRRGQWPKGTEVEIRCLDNQELALRVLVQLETYEDHDHSLSDFDPWDLRHEHRPTPGARNQHECRLPKPPKLAKVPLEQLNDLLREVRSDGWKDRDGRYFFIPPQEWRAEDVDKRDWRSGRAFKREYAPRPRSSRKGPVDYNGLVWLWDEAERHWDVQLKPHLRISHTGEHLKQKR